MLLSAHIVETGRLRALSLLRAQPDPATIAGMKHANTYLTFDLRTGVLPSLGITGAALIAAWEDDEALDRFLDHPLAKRFKGGWMARLDPARSIGQLPGLPDLPRQERPTGDAPVAAYTVGRVRYNRMLPFIKAAGAAERDAQGHPGYIEGLTLMRPPMVIGTLTLWRNVRDMRQYALGSYPGGHARAVKKDSDKHFNHEMFFSRYRVYASEGQWRGRNPLPDLEPSSTVPGPQRALRLGAANGGSARRSEPRDEIGV
jgi:hypothetical protein